MHKNEAVEMVNAGEEITKEALTQAVVNLLNEGGAAKVQVAALAEQLRTMAADLALRTESCERLEARNVELTNLLESVQRTLEHSITRHRPAAAPGFNSLPCELCVDRLDEVKAALAGGEP